MEKKKYNPEDARSLRQKAEEILKMKKSQVTKDVSELEKLKLIHELEVHHIELELQNKELLIAKNKAEAAEEKYTELYNYAPSGFLSISKNSDILNLNFAAARMLGKERSELINKKLSQFIAAESRSAFNIFVQNVLSSNTKKSCEVIIKAEENSAFRDQSLPLYVNIDGLLDNKGENCFLTLIDISERKKAVQDSIAAKEKAEESDRLKSAFLANMSHEIRTPMNGILGFAKLLKKPDLSIDKQKKYVEVIEKSGKRMLNIINDIVNISRIEAGILDIDIGQVNVNEQIEEAYNFLKPEAEAKGIKLYRKNASPTKEVIINSDSEKIYAVLINLLKNAIKYTDSGSIEMGYILKSNNESDELEFYVRDTGIGIPKDRQEAIFERFIQADLSDKKAQQGAGLGLAISKAYVEMLGGRTWVESEEGKGSTLYFTIPYNT